MEEHKLKFKVEYLSVWADCSCGWRSHAWLEKDTLGAKTRAMEFMRQIPHTMDEAKKFFDDLGGEKIY